MSEVTRILTAVEHFFGAAAEAKPKGRRKSMTSRSEND